MKKSLVLLPVLGITVILVLSASFLYSGKSKGSSNEPPPEYIIYTYELKGEELAALQQRYWAADEATKIEMSYEIGHLLGYPDRAIMALLERVLDRPNHFESMMTYSASITVSKRYLVSDGKGNVENVTEEEAYRIAAEINAAREAEFQAQIQKLIRK